MTVRIGINGFGRIGRLAYRASLEHPNVEVVGVNDITDAKTLAHLLKYDSTYGKFQKNVSVDGDKIIVEGNEIKAFSVRNPRDIPWKDVEVDVVIEATGLFRERDKAKLHLDAGAKKVIISAPAKDEDITIVLGVNEKMYDANRHHIISNASCTTNCLAPVAKVIHENFGIDKALMTTIHAYTADQRIMDAPHKDLRRARAAARSMIPTTTGAAKAVALVMPELKGKFHGFAIRVPTETVSVVDLTASLSKSATPDELNDAFREAAKGYLKGILDVSDEPLVSVDYKGNPHSAVVDAPLTMVIEKNMTKVVAWYDNEWGYSHRLIELVEYVMK